jgi:hypothetical protein
MNKIDELYFLLIFPLIKKQSRIYLPFKYFYTATTFHNGNSLKQKHTNTHTHTHTHTHIEMSWKNGQHEWAFNVNIFTSIHPYFDVSIVRKKQKHSANKKKEEEEEEEENVSNLFRKKVVECWLTNVKGTLSRKEQITGKGINQFISHCFISDSIEKPCLSFELKH